MKYLLLLSFLVPLATDAAAQAPAPEPKQTPRRATPATGRSGVALTVTDPGRATLPAVRVQLSGPVERTGETDAGGQVSFPGLPAGTYRIRFSGASVTTFEREVTLRAGQIARLDITLTPLSTEPAAPAEAPAPSAPVLGPTGQPQVLSVVDLVERDLVRNDEPRRDTLVACSGNTRTMLMQLNQPQAGRVYEDAEVAYYVVAGEGVINVGGRDVALAAGGYAALPRGTAHAITRNGRRPLILLAILSGAPCEEAK